MFPYPYTPNNYSNIIKAKLKHQKNSSSSLETKSSIVEEDKMIYNFDDRRKCRNCPLRAKGRRYCFWFMLRNPILRIAFTI